MKINGVPNIPLPDVSDKQIGKNSESISNEATDFAVSSAKHSYVFEGQMRKLQLLQQFSASEIANNKPIQANYATSTVKLGGDDLQRLIDNYRRQIKPKEIKGSRPVTPGASPGHPDSKHGVKVEVQAEIMNKPDKIYSGINKNGRYVDIYYKDGSAVITEQGNKGRVISAYGNVTTKGKAKPFKIENIAKNPNYVEIDLEKLGAVKVMYPNRERFEKNDFPPGPAKNDSAGKTPNAAENSASAKLEAKSKSPTIDEDAPKPSGRFGKGFNRGLLIMELVNLGLAALNFSQLKADGEKFGYYIDPFFDKYVIMNPDKAAENLPEGFELKFYTDPTDHLSQGNYITFTVESGKFTNPDGYSLVYNKEKGFVEAVMVA